MSAFDRRPGELPSLDHQSDGRHPRQRTRHIGGGSRQCQLRGSSVTQCRSYVEILLDLGTDRRGQQGFVFLGSDWDLLSPIWESLAANPAGKAPGLEQWRTRTADALGRALGKLQRLVKTVNGVKQFAVEHEGSRRRVAEQIASSPLVSRSRRSVVTPRPGDHTQCRQLVDIVRIVCPKDSTTIAGRDHALADDLFGGSYEEALPIDCHGCWSEPQNASQYCRGGVRIHTLRGALTLQRRVHRRRPVEIDRDDLGPRHVLGALTTFDKDQHAGVPRSEVACALQL